MSDYKMILGSVHLKQLEVDFEKQRKQGALEELARIRNHLDLLPNRHFKEYLRSNIIKRIKELEGKQ